MTIFIKNRKWMLPYWDITYPTPTPTGVDTTSNFNYRLIKYC